MMTTIRESLASASILLLGLVSVAVFSFWLFGLSSFPGVHRAPIDRVGDVLLFWLPPEPHDCDRFDCSGAF